MATLALNDQLVQSTEMTHYLNSACNPPVLSGPFLTAYATQPAVEGCCTSEDYVDDFDMYCGQPL